MNEKPKIDRPDSVDEKHLVYLDELQKSGVTNMFGAGDYLQDQFDLDRKTSREVLKYWMDSYEERHPE
jgi:hypothetical protein